MTTPPSSNGPGPNGPAGADGHPEPPSPTSAQASPQAADRLTVLAHDLSGMIDGSMRWLALASQTLPEGEVQGDTDRIEKARSQIESVRDTLERMSGMVSAAMKSRGVPIGSPLLGVGESVTIGQAVDHAVDVVRPLAHAYRVGIDVRIEQGAGVCCAGALYSVILNGLRNAVESVVGCDEAEDGDTPGGHVEISAGLGRDQTGRELVIVEVLDDGCGLPEGGSAWAFEHGCSTKDNGGGFGLSISRQIVEEAGGTITLEPRTERRDMDRPGAAFRISVPAAALVSREMGRAG